MLKPLLLALSGLKLGKLLTTGGTMLISVVAYSFVFGWPYAAGFVVLIFIHEMGHYIAARRRGLDVGAPTFIPFVGAWIQLKVLPHDAETEAYVGMGGPLVGSMGALACLFLARALERRPLSIEAETLRREKKLLQHNIITMVSHQLRSPLVAIQQYFEVLLSGIAGELGTSAVGRCQLAVWSQHPSLVICRHHECRWTRLRRFLGGSH